MNAAIALLVFVREKEGRVTPCKTTIHLVQLLGKHTKQCFAIWAKRLENLL